MGERERAGRGVVLRPFPMLLFSGVRGIRILGSSR
jgi:hypothetical protein